MVIGIKSNFETLDLAELCANRIRREVSGSKSIKIVSRGVYNPNFPASYAFSARSENWAATPLSILGIARDSDELSTVPPRLTNGVGRSGGVRLEVVCDEKLLSAVYRIILSNGGMDVKKHCR